MVTHVRGRRSMLDQLDPDHRMPCGLGRCQHDLLEAAAHGLELGHADPGRDQLGVEARPGPSARTTSLARRRAAGPGRRAARSAAPTSGVRTRTSPVGGAAARSCPPAAPAVRGRARPTRVHICSISASRWLERKIVVPARFSPSSSSRMSRMPCGSSPLVGSSSTSSGGRRISAAAEPEPLPHAERVGLHRALVAGVEPDLLEHLGDPGTPTGAPVATAPAGGVEEGEVGAARQVRVGARPLDQGADPGQHRRRRPRHRLAEQLGLARGRQHQAEQHPHRRGLAGAVGAEEAVDVALAHVEVDVVDGRARRRTSWSGRGSGSSASAPSRAPGRSSPARGSAGVTVPVSSRPDVPADQQEHRQRPDLERDALLGHRGVAAAGELLVEVLGHEAAQGYGDAAPSGPGRRSPTAREGPRAPSSRQVRPPRRAAGTARRRWRLLPRREPPAGEAHPAGDRMEVRVS